ncbi:MAG: hypothetical protein ISR69_04435 [Gammaproteobacteria bacterium]|nr:hypothetical protein [Gammaproteobacteria bacterium]
MRKLKAQQAKWIAQNAYSMSKWSVRIVAMKKIALKQIALHSFHLLTFCYPHQQRNFNRLLKRP